MTVWAAGLLHPPRERLDLRPADLGRVERVQAPLGAPHEEHPQVRAGVHAGLALVPAQESRDRHLDPLRPPIVTVAGRISRRAPERVSRRSSRPVRWSLARCRATVRGQTLWPETASSRAPAPTRRPHLPTWWSLPRLCAPAAPPMGDRWEACGTVKP